MVVVCETNVCLFFIWNNFLKWPPKADHIIFPLINSAQYLHIHFLISMLSFFVFIFFWKVLCFWSTLYPIPLQQSRYQYGI